MAVTDIARIEDRIDKTVAGGIEISSSLGGVRVQTMMEVMEAAKLLAVSGPAVPKWLQGNPGGCWAIMVQALEWGLSPISVARMSFEVNGVVGYMSQLLHAVVEKRAPLKTRLRCRYEGEGDQRVCIVTGHFKNEPDPVEYRSPPVGKITPKNSPLWKSDVDQQLWHYSVRAFARRYCPDVLLGIYAKDELEDSEIGPDNARDITPAKPDIAKRLKGKKQDAGFQPAQIEQQISEAKGGEAPVPDQQNGATTNEPQAEQSATPGAANENKPETPLERGIRLLALQKTVDEVRDLYATIDEELTEADQPKWKQFADTRVKEIK